MDHFVRLESEVIGARIQLEFIILSKEFPCLLNCTGQLCPPDLCNEGRNVMIKLTWFIFNSLSPKEAPMMKPSQRFYHRRRCSNDRTEECFVPFVAEVFLSSPVFSSNPDVMSFLP